MTWSVPHQAKTGGNGESFESFQGDPVIREFDEGKLEQQRMSHHQYLKTLEAMDIWQDQLLITVPIGKTYSNWRRKII